MPDTDDTAPLEPDVPETITQSGIIMSDDDLIDTAIAGDNQSIYQTVVIDNFDGHPQPKSLHELDSSHRLIFAKIRARIGNYLDVKENLDHLEPMGEWDLCTQGKLSEADILQTYTRAADLPVAEDDQMENLEIYPDLSFEYLMHWLCIPMEWDGETVVLALAYPYNLGPISYQWKKLMGLKASFYLAPRSHIERLITELYEKGPDDGTDGLGWDGDTSEEALQQLALEAPIVRLVNDMFMRAIELNASDIHVEPSENDLAIRYRIDGVLQTILTPPIASYAAIASRLKLIGGLNIAERRLPQDGRTDLQIGRAQIDIRISTVPSMHGESIVLRILRKDITSFSFSNIGIMGEIGDSFRDIIASPYGMILVVGPTGSGKTTTLYCAMNKLNSAEKKIITIEDPVEYQISGVTQIQVNASIGLTFASGLRHIVRQDPDIILVGEIRDKETAEIAIHAALTGHLVLSTLHTNDAAGAISRLQDMGVDNFLISSTLIGVLSQRLIRRICDTCKGSGFVQADSTVFSDELLEDTEQMTQLGGKPCKACAGRGLKGRIGIFEYMRVDGDLRRAISDGTDASGLNRIAQGNGMKTISEDGEDKIRRGITKRAEVLGVCQLDI
ncbi:MAG TPA: type II secretion system protein GspE [Nitrospirales bacterium]|nr:type II secretion system protein GspE [Nitrospirales bacterium]